jgi:hypothetical protein
MYKEFTKYVKTDLTTRRSWGNPVPITCKFVLITVSKFSERQIRPFRAFPVEAATRYVGSDE